MNGNAQKLLLGVATRLDLRNDQRMNGISARPAATGSVALWERHLGLAPSLRMLLQLKSLIMPPASKADFAECMRASGSRTPDGKVWSAVAVDTWSAELRRQGLLTRDHAFPDGRRRSSPALSRRRDPS
jgi:hypothetical protein